MSPRVLRVKCLTVVILFTVGTNCLPWRLSPEKKSEGSTVNLQEIFTGRCWEFQRVVNPDAFQNGTKDCEVLWELFMKGFSFVEPCDTVTEDFVPFSLEAVYDIPENATMFWSGAYPFVQEYSNRGRRYTTISDSLSGYVVDELVFCGQINDPGINYEHCPHWSECDDVTAVNAFWQATSIQFAKQATGVTQVLLNATRVPAFREDSTFGQFELPYLRPERVTLLHALLVHDVDTPQLEICGEGSLKRLEEIATEQGLTFQCTENPIDIQHLFCVDNPNDPDCDFQ